MFTVVALHYENNAWGASFSTAGFDSYMPLITVYVQCALNAQCAITQFAHMFDAKQLILDACSSAEINKKAKKNVSWPAVRAAYS